MIVRLNTLYIGNVSCDFSSDIALENFCTLKFVLFNISGRVESFGVIYVVILSVPQYIHIYCLRIAI